MKGASTLGLSLLVHALVAIGGGVSTSASVKTWYPTLRKAPWSPPAWAFGPAWTVLYACMAVAAWRVSRVAGLVSVPMAAYALQLALNAAWSPAFFGYRSTRAGMAIILALLPAVALTLHTFSSVDVTATWLLVPYAAWIAYAATLNAYVVASRASESRGIRSSPSNTSLPACTAHQVATGFLR